MRADMAEYTAAGNTLHHHWQGLRPPTMHPYLFEDIVFNPFAIAVAQRVCGHSEDGSLVLSGYNANVAYATDEAAGHPPAMQEVHTDSAEPYDEFADGYTPPRSVYFNVMLCDTAADTGATECWLGTHRDSGLRRGLGFGDAAAGERRSTSWPTPQMRVDWERAHGPPVRCTAAAGDIFMRDARVWHRGRANHGEDNRPMIRSGYSSGPGPARKQLSPGLEAAVGSEEFWRHPVVACQPRFLPAPLLYPDTDRYNPPVSSKEFDSLLPGKFGCGLTSMLMTDPVRASCGIAFERQEIELWLASFERKGHLPLRCPNGNVALDIDAAGRAILVPDTALKSEIDGWVAKHLLARL